jgi:hypothetical protein
MTPVALVCTQTLWKEPRTGLLDTRFVWQLKTRPGNKPIYDTKGKLQGAGETTSSETSELCEGTSLRTYDELYNIIKSLVGVFL